LRAHRGVAVDDLSQEENEMNVTRALVVTVGVLVIAVLGFGAYAVAQTDGFGPAWRGGGWHDGGPGWGGRHGPPEPEQVRAFRADLAADLANQLDTSADDVEAAFRGVVAERLDEAVAEGRIDEADVDEALAAYDDGDIRTLFRTVHHAGDEATDRP
jgi:hypothetical protein